MGSEGNVAKSKGIIMVGEEGLVCEVSVDGRQLKYVSEFLSIWDLC